MSKEPQRAAPSLFMCPISLEIMKDPVTVCTGQTYDRSSIEKWLQQGHTTCPVTMLYLHDLSLIPNLIVRHQIQSWLSEQPTYESKNYDNCHLLKHTVDRKQIRFLLWRIARGYNLKAALRDLNSVAKSDENRLHIVEAGGTLLLVSLLFEDHDEFGVYEEVLCLLALLSKDSVEAKTVVIESRPSSVVWFLMHGSTDERIHAAALLKSLMAVEDFRTKLGESPDFMMSLLSLLKKETSPRATKSLAKILYLICVQKEKRVVAVKAGAVGTLVELLADAPTLLMEKLLATLELLCTISEGQSEACKHALTVPLLVKKVLGFSHQCTEHAVGSLLSICKLGPVEALQDAMQVGAGQQLLLLLQIDCTDRAKRKALELLKLFYAIFEEDLQIPAAPLKSFCVLS